ncbi:hypothetical protein SNE40_011365 [Patella caerulea]|uniref:Uncharacterized protein n=1 Tax=Patella caerulea TaxID=87958 RepID=A0AAN8JPR1_PATCE
MLMLGRDVLFPADILTGTYRAESGAASPDDWVRHQVGILSSAHGETRSNTQQGQKRQKQLYDLRLNFTKFEPGDVVYVLDSSSKIRQSKNLPPPWKCPYLVLFADPPLYRLDTRKRKIVVHHDRIKRCLDREFPLWLKRRRHIFLGLEDDVGTTEKPIGYQELGVQVVILARKRKIVVHHVRIKRCLDREFPLWLKRRRHIFLGLGDDVGTTEKPIGYQELGVQVVIIAAMD